MKDGSVLRFLPFIWTNGPLRRINAVRLAATDPVPEPARKPEPEPAFQPQPLDAYHGGFPKPVVRLSNRIKEQLSD